MSPSTPDLVLSLVGPEMTVVSELAQEVGYPVIVVQRILRQWERLGRVRLWRHYWDGDDRRRVSLVAVRT